MEQTIPQEPLFLLLGELVCEPVPDLGQESLFPGSKGRDGLFLPLICSVKIPHEQIKGLHLTIDNGIFLDDHVQWDIGSHIMDTICSSPSQGAMDSFPQGRVTIGLPKGLELITPLDTSWAEPKEASCLLCISCWRADIIC